MIFGAGAVLLTVFVVRGALALGKDALGALRRFDAWRERKANGDRVADHVRQRYAG